MDWFAEETKAFLSEGEAALERAETPEEKLAFDATFCELFTRLEHANSRYVFWLIFQSIGVVVIGAVFGLKWGVVGILVMLGIPAGVKWRIDAKETNPEVWHFIHPSKLNVFPRNSPEVTKYLEPKIFVELRYLADQRKAFSDTALTIWLFGMLGWFFLSFANDDGIIVGVGMVLFILYVAEIFGLLEWVRW